MDKSKKVTNSNTSRPAEATTANENATSNNCRGGQQQRRRRQRQRQLQRQLQRHRHHHHHHHHHDDDDDDNNNNNNHHNHNHNNHNPQQTTATTSLPPANKQQEKPHTLGKATERTATLVGKLWPLLEESISLPGRIPARDQYAHVELQTRNGFVGLEFLKLWSETAREPSLPGHQSGPAPSDLLSNTG